MKQHIIIDSGAFSAWTSDVKIDLNQYIEFCLEYEDVVETFVGLDVIPGKKNDTTRPSKTAIEKACEEGWENYLKMTAAGLPKKKVMPVIHQFDDIRWLDVALKEKVPYIGLSPSKVKVTRESQMIWLNRCMEKLTDSTGRPKVKIHGMGVTSIPIIVRYPWYSVDSSVVLRRGTSGLIIIPWKEDGKWNFFKSPRSVSISSRSKTRKEHRQHYLTLPPTAKNLIMEYLEETGFPLGKSEYREESLEFEVVKGQHNILEKTKTHLLVEHIVEPGVLNCRRIRVALNLRYFDLVMKAMKDIPAKFQPIGNQGDKLFEDDGDTSGLDFKGCRIFTAGFEGGTEAGQELIDTKYRLLSYAFINSSQKEEFEIRTRRARHGD